MTYVTGH